MPGFPVGGHILCLYRKPFICNVCYVSGRVQHDDLHQICAQCVSYFLQCLILFNTFFCLVCPSPEKKMLTVTACPESMKIATRMCKQSWWNHSLHCAIFPCLFQGRRRAIYRPILTFSFVSDILFLVWWLQEVCNNTL